MNSYPPPCRFPSPSSPPSPPSLSSLPTTTPFPNFISPFLFSLSSPSPCLPPLFPLSEHSLPTLRTLSEHSPCTQGAEDALATLYDAIASYYPQSSDDDDDKGDGKGDGKGSSGSSESGGSGIQSKAEWRGVILHRFCSIARKYPEMMGRVIEEKEDSGDDPLSKAMTQALATCRSAREWASQPH